MIQAAQTLYNWWNLMAEMYAKYGTPVDIEEKPEWEQLQKIQQDLLHSLEIHTGTPEEILFENVQRALLEVLGTEETVLSYDEAVEVVEVAIRFSLQEEIQVVRASGLLN